MPAAISAVDLQNHIHILDRCSGLNWLSTDQKVVVAKLSRIVALDGREALFRQGDRATRMYILIEGGVEVLQKSGDGNESLLLRSYFSAGDSVGEWAASRQDHLRSATVQTVSASRFLEVDYKVFEEIGEQREFIQHSIESGEQYARRDQLVQSSPLFHLLIDGTTLPLETSEETYPDGDEIFAEGQPSKVVYFIITGAVDVLQRRNDQEFHLARLNPGQILGELGVIRGEKRSASARAHGATRLLVVKAGQFLELAGSQPMLADGLNTLRKVYQNGAGDLILQFLDRVGGEPVLISSMHLKSGQRVVSQYSLKQLKLSIKLDPGTQQALVFTYEDRQRDICRQLSFQAGKIIASDLRGPCLEVGQIVAAIRNGTVFPAETIKTFEQTGTLFGEAPPGDIVCHCMQLTRDDLLDEMKLQHRDLSSLMRACGAGTVCGGCRGELEQICGEADSIPCQIQDASEVATGTWQMRLAPSDGRELSPFRSGQHISIEGIIQGRSVMRTYTLTCAQDETRWREITIQQEPHGLFSRWLTDHPLAQKEIKISSPRGIFTPDLTAKSPVVCLVAGIGVTPALSFARTRARLHKGSPLIIDHSARTTKQLVGQQELEKIQQMKQGIEYRPRVTTAGQRLTRQDLVDLNRCHPGASWMLCGPERFESQVLEWLTELKIPDSRIQRERFSPPGSAKAGSLQKDRISLLLGIVTTLITCIVLLTGAVPDALQRWQSTTLGHWVSGSALLLFLALQWWMPWKRIARAEVDEARALLWHRRLGAFSPLLLLLHGSSLGAGLLGLITFLFLTNALIGVADRSIISSASGQSAYLRWWLVPHISIAILVTAFSLLHLWVILGHGGP